MKSVVASLFFLLIYVGESVAQITLNPTPTRVIGQDSLQVTNLNPNLVEGREFFNPQGIALDTTTSPPALYVSDTNNNRVLGFRSAVGFANGQRADLVVGQPDMGTTFPEGPGKTALNISLTTGFTSPTGLAVDSKGNLYVVDAGNNRILRFPKPFAQSGQAVPDLVIGQAGFTAASANQGATGPTASSLSFAAGTQTLGAFIAFDPAGDLWVADAGNNRVLRFNVSVLGSPPAQGPSADIVLGQPNFTSSAYSPLAGTNALISVTALLTPTGITFDAAGRLFVAESSSTRRGRILMWTPPFATAQSASRLLGVDQSNPAPPAVSQFQPGAGPGGLFPVGNGIGIADTFDNRVLVFPPVEQWTPNTTFQAAIEVAGQPDFTSASPNQGFISATAATLALPAAAVFFNSELYVVDSGNNRVLAMAQNGSSFGPATAVLGQDAFNLTDVNLVEGREFDFVSTAGSVDTGMAVDLAANPPHLYVSDTYNNRILGFKDLRNIQPGAKADIVIGQPDFQQTLINYPTNSAATPNSSGLLEPVGLAVDFSGNLYVADAGNGRVLRFPAPFANYVAGTPEQADLVLGQQNFTTTIRQATQRTMASPYGLAFTNAPGLLVSDVALNRVLYFQGTSAQFTSGMQAAMVFGQPNFTSAGSGSGLAQLSLPHHIATDGSDRLYVADAGNGRVSIWNNAPASTIGSPAAQALISGLNSPRGVYVSPVTGEIWVADAGSNQAVRFPPYLQLEANGFTSNGSVPDIFHPVAVVEDGWGNLFAADAANRVITYYPALVPENAAEYLYPNVLAPGMITSLFSLGNQNQFGGQPVSAQNLPLPTQMNGVQVMFNGSAVPLIFAGPNQINFLVPMAAPQSGTADLQVLEIATGRVLGDTTVGMTSTVPGLFSQTGNGSGTLAALNQDNTPNGPTNQALQGSTIQIFGTGQGFIPGAPPDGYPAPSGGLKAPMAPTVIVGADFVTGSGVPYSGLAPGFAGLWQINVVIPNDVITTPTNPTYVIVLQNSVASGSPSTGRAVQIYVKQKP